MKNYEFTQNFRSLYDKAVRLYKKGKRGAGGFFTRKEKAWLAANGLTAQHLYDYAEDENNYKEPGYDRALGIELIRRDYFILEQHGKRSRKVLKGDKLPPKDATVRGFGWLPRIIPKAQAKLRGELPPSLMYCCGGDRRFFKANDILPSEFLAVVWKFEKSPTAIVNWMARRRAAAR
jgi:hypothetical protein